MEITNSKQEAEQLKRKEMAEEIAKIPIEQQRRFLDWINELILEDDED